MRTTSRIAWRRISRNAVLLAGLAVLVPSADLPACSVPVFRYALERWQPGAFEVVVFHDGLLSAAVIGKTAADDPVLPVLFARALRLRCPHCGGGPIFVTWSRLVPNCPVCGIGLERGEQGYWLGAYFFNLMAVETVFTVWVVGFLVWTWPTPPWALFQISTLILMLIVRPSGLFPKRLRQYQAG